MNYLDYFKEMCSIPHGSGNTKRISDWLVDFAKEHNLEYHQDEANNVIIIREASKGCEDKAPVIIQGHMDMVAVKDADCDIDMEVEGLRLKEDGDLLYAEGTSLGGDDGVAVAYGLALLADEEHSFPRLELVVTVDEEIGMLGADVIDVSCCKGRMLMNIDSEEEGIFLVSCAGGARMDFDFSMQEVEAGAELNAYSISISGLIGGHSGTEINKGRANAIVLMGKILRKLDDAKLLYGIGSINGGTADNAICIGCNATILAKAIEPELFEIIKFEVLEDYVSVETGASITLKALSLDEKPAKWYWNSEDNLDRFMTSLPNGVLAMSHDIEGLVETSLNQGIINMNEGTVSLSVSVRSNIDEKKDELIKQLTGIADMHHVKTGVRGDYPGWAYKKDSVLREKMIEVYKDMFNKDVKVEALHAGLECGVFAKKLPGLDAVSFGPDLFDIHTTKERLSLSSAERYYNFIVRVLETL